MANEFVLPKLANAMQQGTILKWEFAEGEQVEKGQGDKK